MGLPHKANVGEIIRVKGYDTLLFLVTEWSEEKMHGKHGMEETVSYTCQNIDNYKDIKIIFDQDIASIVVTAERSDAFIKARQGSAQPPAIRKEDKPDTGKLDAAALLQQFAEARQAKTQPGNRKKPKSPYEEARIKEKEDREYIDYLLDAYAMLKSLDEVLGEDEERNEELRMLKEEFDEKSAELYGKSSK